MHFSVIPIIHFVYQSVATCICKTQCCTGTHDIQNISVSSPQPGEVKVTGDFINESTATGVLTVSVDFSTSKIFYHLIKRENNKQQLDDTIQGVVGGEHSISFFVVEESGLLFNRTASMPKVVTVENGGSDVTVVASTSTVTALLFD